MSVYCRFLFELLKVLISWCVVVLQDWQLKLSGIDAAAAKNGDTTEETDIDSDSPRSPVGATNPLMLQQCNEGEC